MNLFYVLLVLWACFAIVSFCFLLFKPAPYGRHATTGYGPLMNGTLGWMLMEFPAVLFFPLLYFSGSCLLDFYSIAFLCMWELHYLHRTFLYAWRRKNTLKPMPVLIVVMGMMFNSINASLISFWMNGFSECLENRIYVPFFFLGATLFFIGFMINFSSDEKLLKIRKQNRGYQIPQGGMFTYVTCPNYLGEIIEWTGFALASLSLPAFLFVLWTCANLVPRALSHHAWYRAQFPDYPAERKAIFPFLL